MKKFFTLMMALSLSGCGWVSFYDKPDLGLSGNWREVQAVSSTAPRVEQWWTLYDNDELNGMMQQALAGNTDLAAALQRVKQARSQVTVAGAALLPSVSVGAGADKNIKGGNGDITASANGTVSYGFDLWGGNVASKRAAKSSLDASTFAAKATRLTLTGEVAQTYFNQLALRERVVMQEQSLLQSQGILKIVQARFDAGAASGLDLAQQKTQVAQTQASVASLKQSVESNLTALAVLLGEQPVSVTMPRGSISATTIPLALVEAPAIVMMQRPDVQQAEANLRTAHANVDVARAALFPQLSASLNAVQGIGPGGLAASIGASVLQPIFEGGRLRAEVTISKAEEEELLQTYKGVVLAALKQVEDAVVGVNTAQARLGQLQEAADNARKSADLSRQQFDVGSVDMQTLLDAQRTLLSANDALAQAKADALNASVILILAVGGSPRV
jgi:NodT family efflux transporter outer membrane factor (OMF) lipoprotein